MHLYPKFTNGMSQNKCKYLVISKILFIFGVIKYIKYILKQ